MFPLFNNFSGINMIILAVILFGIWLIFREVLLWYWKVNNIISILYRIDDNLKIIADNNLSTKTEYLKSEEEPPVT